MVPRLRRLKLIYRSQINHMLRVARAENTQMISLSCGRESTHDLINLDAASCSTAQEPSTKGPKHCRDLWSSSCRYTQTAYDSLTELRCFTGAKSQRLSGGHLSVPFHIQSPLGNMRALPVPPRSFEAYCLRRIYTVCSEAPRTTQHLTI